jgi:modulator of FtsH protease HflC
MKPSLLGGAITVILAIAAIVGYSTFFTVYQTTQALVVRLGQPVRVITDPGLNAKIPFIDAVIYIDKRILNIESPAQEVIASSGDRSNANVAQAGERLVVDAFARYRIVDPLKFYQTVGPDGANSQLSILLNSALRRVLGAATLAGYWAHRGGASIECSEARGLNMGRRSAALEPNFRPVGAVG